MANKNKNIIFYIIIGILVVFLLIAIFRPPNSNITSTTENFSCPELDYSTCPISDCSTCPIKTETIIETKYVCSDGETTVDSLANCPTQETILAESDYDFIEVNKTITSYSTYFKNDIKVTLLKIGTKTYNDKMRVRVYWKIENPGTKTISVYPHLHTLILDNAGGQYESTLFGGDKESDDFMIGNSTGGELRPGVIAQGGVNVDNVPTSATSLKIILDTPGFDNIEYGVKLN